MGSTFWQSKIPHLEGKHAGTSHPPRWREQCLIYVYIAANEYLKASGLNHTSIYNCAYFEVLGPQHVQFAMSKLLPDGSIQLTIPIPQDCYVPWYAVGQSGGWVLEALKNPAEWMGD